LILGPLHAVPLLVALELVAGARLVPEAWSASEARATASLAIPACLAIPVGASLLGALPAATARRAIALVVLGLVAALATGYRRRGPLRRRVAVAAGTASGLLSGFAGVGGPPIVLLVLSGAEQAARQRARLILYFAATQVAATLVFAWRGWIDGVVLWHLLLVAPGFLLGTHIGARRFEPANERRYRRVGLGLLALAAIPALW
ncbi:MAG TPA: sulfite exporter TauE/SafE family protein, partial [Candidatus Polarisedimenticolaceae bacterium]|nr:sulfite exporter TauE/SafE family protein [Candidatus Polarisedimenticolaceae bacterium]